MDAVTQPPRLTELERGRWDVRSGHPELHPLVRVFRRHTGTHVGGTREGADQTPLRA